MSRSHFIPNPLHDCCLLLGNIHEDTAWLSVITIVFSMPFIPYCCIPVSFSKYFPLETHQGLLIPTPREALPCLVQLQLHPTPTSTRVNTDPTSSLTLFSTRRKHLSPPYTNTRSRTSRHSLSRRPIHSSSSPLHLARPCSTSFPLSMPSLLRAP